MSELLTVGVSHQTAPVALRERLALPADGGPVLGELAACSNGIRELVAMTTCNRTEIVALTDDPEATEQGVLGVLARRGGFDPEDLGGAVFRLHGEDAARHLLRVAAGIESMVLGEAEILGQLRRAHEIAVAAGISGPTLDRLFHSALATGGRVRAETRIGHGAASISSLAVRLAERELGDLEGRQVLIVGAGETAELAAKAFHQRGVASLFVANRHINRAVCLAAQFDGGVAPLDELPGMLATTDVVVTATASPHPVIGRAAVEAALPRRDGRPLVLIDLAVPRDIEVETELLPGVRRYDLDAMQAAVDATNETRAAAVGDAALIVDVELEHFAAWMATRGVAPTVAALHRAADEIVERVLAENAGRWEGATAQDLARIEAVARAVATRLLHEPTIRLRALGADAQVHVEALRELFGLDRAFDEAGAPDELNQRRP